MRKTWRLVTLCVCVLAVAGCRKTKDERRGYQDDREIGSGTDVVDGALAVPLRTVRETEIMTILYSINQLIQVDALTAGSNPKDLDEVKALWQRETRRPWPAPVYRYKYTYDPVAGKVGQVHKTPDEYTPEERAGAPRKPE